MHGKLKEAKKGHRTLTFSSRGGKTAIELFVAGVLG